MMTKQEIAKLGKGYHPNVRLMDKNPRQGRGKSFPNMGRIWKHLRTFFPNPINDPL